MVNVLKPNLCLSVCNPSTSSLWDDPQLFDLPLRFKPTFSDKDLIENLSFNLITPNGSFDLNACLDVFGYSFGRDNLNHITLISSLIFIG